MKKIYPLLSLILLLFNYNGFSQSGSKMNFGAALAANNPKQQEDNITLLVKGNVPAIQRVMEQSGGKFRYSVGDIASVTIKVKNMRSLAASPYIRRIEAGNPFSKVRPMNDTALIHDDALPVHAGTVPLAQAYTGKGVVVGIIDTGIDYSHPDFQDSLGKSRIKFLWDQVLPDSVPPQPYNYGQEWTGADIDNGKAIAHLNTATASYGHGTHVSSVAAGNGLALNKFKGVAPKADIIFVAANLNSTNAIMDGVKYIYDKATALGEPCVINISLGDYYGSHDGKNLEAQTIKTLITAQSGRALAAAAGNAGKYRIHVGYTVTSDTNFTWFTGPAYIAMYADTNNFKNVQFAIGADKVTPSYSYRGRTAFSSITSSVGVLKNDTIFNGSNRICTMQTYGDTANGVYSMEFAITPDSSAYEWRLMTTGSGKFDVYTFDVDTAHLADSTIYAPLKKYKQPDFNQNMVTSFQCLDEVITVGNYTNRNHYLDYDTIMQKDSTRIPGNLFESSSHGPTRDGRIKPDITSPGDWTLAATSLRLVPWHLANGNHYKLCPGGYHIMDGGTSNASPGVAGVVALYFQMQPLASWQDVKNAIINCARVDSFTGNNLPNSYWGYGKADAFKAMTGCATAVTNNQVNETDGLSIYPNPASNDANIIITLTGKDQNAELVIYNVLGNKMKTIKVKNSDHIVIRRGSLASGIYFCTLHAADQIITTQKLIISE